MLAKGRGHHSVVEVLKGAGAQYDSSDESIDEEMVSTILNNPLYSDGFFHTYQASMLRF